MEEDNLEEELGLETEKKPVGRSRTMILLIAAIFLVAGLAAGGVYVWQNGLVSAEKSKVLTLEKEKQDLSTKVTELEEQISKIRLEEEVRVAEEQALIEETKDATTSTKSSLAAGDNPVSKAIKGQEVLYGYTYNDEDFVDSTTKTRVTLSTEAQNQLDANGEVIKSQTAPVNPENANMIFISTSEGRSLASNINRIYAYNTKTGELFEIYKEEEPRILETVGIDGSKLILYYTVVETTPGFCYNIWVDADDFLYLELSDLDLDLQSYRVPLYQQEIGQTEKDDCLKEAVR